MSSPRLLETSALARALEPLRAFEAGSQGLAPEQLAEALGQLERAKALLWLRLWAGAKSGAAAEPDRLLEAEEAAARLGIAADTLYRKAKRFPFTVRLGHQVRFSAAGISKFIRERQGKP